MHLIKYNVQQILNTEDGGTPVDGTTVSKHVGDYYLS
jgi:hypothetical protein